MTTMLDAALTHAQAGRRVFPLYTIRNGTCTCGGGKGCSPGKHPIGALAPRGVLNATTDPALVTTWWTQLPEANIGIATGRNSNLVVLDVDGAKGEAFLAFVEAKHGPLPPTLEVKTGKGRHLYFRYPDNVAKVKSVAHKETGLDVRADGGYVVGPPSIHVSGHQYVFAPNAPDDFPECPAWIVAYANGEMAARTRKETPPTPYSEDEEARLRSALAHIPADDRDTWRDTGAALHSLGWGDKGFDIWTDWSRTCAEKFDPADQQKTWESFDRPYDGPRITTATIFFMARQRGWVDETQSHDYHTDLGNARRFVKRHGENIRFVPEWRTWLVWNGYRWSIDGDGAVMRLAKETVEALYAEAVESPSKAERDQLLRHAIRSQAEARLKAMVSLAESETALVVAAHRLDADPWLLGVRNGVIDLQTGQFRPARREDLITKHANVSFDRRARCPNWIKFLRTVTDGDGARQAYMQRVSGYALTGSAREEVLFVLYGTGNNGKSTYRETMHSLLGDYALAADAGLLIERKTPGGATPELARLKGRRLVSINETSENEHLNEARVKFITSQDKITARNLYQDFFDFDPTHKTFLTTNHKPIIRGTDVGIWRRIHLLPFTVAIAPEKVEKDFRERRLMPELSGILNWALAGLAMYRKQGLNPPTTVLASTQEYRDDMDVVGQWIGECCVVDPRATVATSAAYDNYRQWAADEVGWELKKLTFRRHLSDRGFGAAKAAHGQRVIRGLRLKRAGASSGFSCGRPVGNQTAGNAGPSSERVSVLLKLSEPQPALQ